MAHIQFDVKSFVETEAAEHRDAKVSNVVKLYVTVHFHTSEVINLFVALVK